MNFRESRKKSEKNCVLCNTPVTKKSLSDNGICRQCTKILPDSIKNKFSLWTSIPPIIIFILGLLFLSIGAYYLVPWMVLPFDVIFEWQYSKTTYILILLGILSFVLSLNFPKLGRFFFKRWLHNPENLTKLEKILDSRNQNNQQHTSKSDNHFSKQKSLMIIVIFALAIISNILIFLILIQYSWNFQNTQNQVYCDVISIIWILSSFISTGMALDPSNRLQTINFWHTFLRKIWLSITILGIFIVFGGKIYLVPSISGFFYAEPEWVQFISDFWSISVYVLCGLLLVLAIDLLFSEILLSSKKIKKKREYEYDNSSIIDGIKKIFRIFLIPSYYISFVFIVIVSIAGFMLVLGDYFMLISFFSVDIALGIVFPLIIYMGLVRKYSDFHKKRNISNFGGITKYLVLIFGILLVPIIIVPVYSTPSLDDQFESNFGGNWEEEALLKCKNAGFDTLRTSRYSIFDNFFGYNISCNILFNIAYMNDYPPRVDDAEGNSSTIEHTFYFDAYLPNQVFFNISSEPVNPMLPVVIMLHGEVEDKGAWNANMTSQYLAKKGFLVCDLNYGYLRTNNNGLNNTGYYLRDLIRQIGQFTKFLEINQDYFHADLSKVYFSGRHLGGGLALLCGMGYNTTLTEYFSPSLNVQGIIPYYPVSDIGDGTTFFKDTILYYGETFINGSSDPSDPNYNSDWNLLNPIEMLDFISSEIAPIFFITGTHDWLITMRYSQPFIDLAREKNLRVIFGKYLLGNDGFDGLHSSPYGQNVIFYLERFLFLTLP